METLRKSVAEAKGRAARAEAEAALQGAAVARLEAQVARLKARQDHQDEHEEQLKQERRRLQREVSLPRHLYPTTMLLYLTSSGNQLEMAPLVKEKEKESSLDSICRH